MLFNILVTGVGPEHQDPVVSWSCQRKNSGKTHRGVSYNEVYLKGSKSEGKQSSRGN
jgi:hypothetical protein